MVIEGAGDIIMRGRSTDLQCAWAVNVLSA